MLRGLLKLMGAYKLYEWLLLREIKSGVIPSHVAFILDGNRRWAESKGLPRWAGYEFGAEKAEQVVEWCFELGIRTVTLYVLSTENIRKRRPEELSKIYDAIVKHAEKALKEGKLEKEGVRVRVIGVKELLPHRVREALEKLEERTKGNSKFFLNLAVAYGGRAEIANAARRLAEDVAAGKIRPEDIDESLFSKYLFTSDLPQPDPDLVIRTSGESRVSNFLLWQIAYSELVFLDVYWPEFRKIDLLRAIRVYQQRKRRFGA